MTIQQAYARGATALEQAGIQNARNEARFLLLDALQMDTARLLLAYPQPLQDAAWTVYWAKVCRRLEGEPLQYILGYEDFLGLHLKICPGVLIPRPDTQTLALETIRMVEDVCAPWVLDLCCGSGAVGLAVASRLPDARVVLGDIALECIRLSEQNAKDLGLEHRVQVVRADLLEGIPRRRYDALCSNPPYIPDAELPGLQREVRDYEPHLALRGGKDGLDFYRRIIQEAPLYADHLLLEVGDGQAEAVSALLDAAAYEQVEQVLDDYQKIRVVRGRCPRKESYDPQA